MPHNLCKRAAALKGNTEYLRKTLVFQTLLKTLEIVYIKNALKAEYKVGKKLESKYLTKLGCTCTTEHE